MSDTASDDAVLTLELATQLLGNQQGDHFLTYPLPYGTIDVLDLSQFGQMDVDAATHLVSQYTRPIKLGLLHSVSSELANALAQHDNTFVFGDAAALSVDLARALASRRNLIIVESAAGLSLAAAKELLTPNVTGLILGDLPSAFVDAIEAERASFHGGMCPLYSLRVQSDEQLDERSAAALGSIRNLNLDKVSVVNAKAAEGLAHVTGELSLNGLREMSEGVARALGGMTVGMLCLDGLRQVPDPVASLLFQRQGAFNLNGLLSLSHVAAQCLGRTHGYLSLNALEHMSDEAAVEIAKRDGDLYLDGLVAISAKTAAALGKQKVDKGCGSLSLAGLTHMTPAVSKGLAKAKHYSLNLSGITTLDSATAKEVAAFRAKTLDLSGLREISADAALELIGYRGRLSIDDDHFRQLPAGTRRVLGKHRSLRSMT